MTTEEQILSNRENAQNSTGPKTEEGKDKSRLNATRHGITSDLLTEHDRKQVGVSLNDLATEFGPRNAIENIFFEQVILSYVRLNRATKMESEIFEKMLVDQSGYNTAIILINDGNMLNPLELTNRYFTDCQNRLFKTLDKYMDIRKKTDENLGLFRKKEDVA